MEHEAMTYMDGFPARFDVGASVAAYSSDLIAAASELMGVQLATEAARCARPEVPFGALLAEQLSVVSGDTFSQVMSAFPDLVDAEADDDPVVEAACQAIESAIDRLIAAGFQFAGMAGAVR